MPGAPRRTDSGQSSNAATDCGADFSHRRSAGALRSMSATMKSGSAMASRSFADEWAVGLTARHMLAGETAGGRRAGEAVIRQAGTRESGKGPGQSWRFKRIPHLGDEAYFPSRCNTLQIDGSLLPPHHIKEPHMKIQACRVIFLIFLGLLSQVASAQPADRNTCNGEVARFLKATNQKYGSNADITFRRTCESSGVSAAYAAVGHSELAPSPRPGRPAARAARVRPGARPRTRTARQGATRARQRRHRQTTVPLQRRRRSVRAHRPASAVQGHRTDQQPVLLRDPDHVLFGGRRCERDSQGRKVSDCSRRLTGAKTLRAGQSDTFNVGAIGVRTHYIACRDPFYAPANALTWNGVGFSGRCQANN